MAIWQPSTLARYLFAAYVPLVVYASLHPFSGWRDRGLPPFAFLTAPFPRPIPVFDVVANIIGYMPLGFLAVLAVYPWLRRSYALGFGLACSVSLSFALESLQLYLPMRTSSNLDLLANTVGGAVGALAALATTRPLLDAEGSAPAICAIYSRRPRASSTPPKYSCAWRPVSPARTASPRDCSPCALPHAASRRGAWS